MQSNILIGTDEITGTLLYITGYTGFSSNVDEQSGNYLALKMGTTPSEGVTTTIELLGGTIGHPVQLDSDMNAVLRITNTATQSVEIVATKGDVTITKSYALTNIVLTPAE